MLEQKPCPFLAQMRELCVRFHALFHRFTCAGAHYFRRIRHLAYSCLEIARIRPAHKTARSTMAKTTMNQMAAWASTQKVHFITLCLEQFPTMQLFIKYLFAAYNLS